MENIFSRCLTVLKKYPITAWGAILFLKLTGKEIIKTGKCNCCGSCCRNINLQVNGSWLKSENEFVRVVEKAPQYQRFYSCGKDGQGYLQLKCSFLNSEGNCKEYKNRLDICKRFPEKSLVLCGGKLPENCGYSVTAGVSFSKRLDRAQKKV